MRIEKVNGPIRHAYIEHFKLTWLHVLCLAALSLSCAASPRPLRLATTTSLDSSGLLDVLLSAFRTETGIDVQALAVGSGKAMQLARRGDADLVVAHDPAGEEELLREGRVLVYRKIMFSDFVVAGPTGDPAQVRDATDALDAMRRIARSASPFVSRGDRSGTHASEERLWEECGVRPAPDRLLETGSGMAATLRVASERSAYCLTDRATFLQLARRLALAPLFEDDDRLLNTYSVIVMRQATDDRQRAALRLAEWLSDGAGRRLIANFTVGPARPFTPWPDGAPRDRPDSKPGL